MINKYAAGWEEDQQKAKEFLTRWARSPNVPEQRICALSRATPEMLKGRKKRFVAVSWVVSWLVCLIFEQLSSAAMFSSRSSATKVSFCGGVSSGWDCPVLHSTARAAVSDLTPHLPHEQPAWPAWRCPWGSSSRFWVCSAQPREVRLLSWSPQPRQVWLRQLPFHGQLSHPYFTPTSW